MSAATDNPLLDRAARAVHHCDRQAVSWRRWHFRARMVVLVLGLVTSSAGATLVSSGPGDSPVTAMLRVLAVLLPVVAAGMTALLGTLNMATRWTAYRAAAETIKSEAFLYAAGVEKYRGGDRDRVLEQRLDAVEEDLARQVRPKAKEA